MSVSIAIIDDDDCLLELESELLKEQGARVSTFLSAESFFDFSEKNDPNQFDFLLVDRFLEEEGIDAIEEKLGLHFKSKDRVLHGVGYSKFLVLVSNSRPDDDSCKKAGFDGFLRKHDISLNRIVGLGNKSSLDVK